MGRVAKTVTLFGPWQVDCVSLSNLNIPYGIILLNIPAERNLAGIYRSGRAIYSPSGMSGSGISENLYGKFCFPWESYNKYNTVNLQRKPPCESPNEDSLFSKNHF